MQEAVLTSARWRVLGIDVNAWLAMASDSFGSGMYQHLQKEGWHVHNMRCKATPLTVGVLGDGHTTLLMQKPTPSEMFMTREIVDTISDGIALIQPRIIFATSVGEIELPFVRALF
ncbi:MAG: hypothetical protein HY981_02965 [Candidatus Magasanikbacteria bacterium]|nr:hypothetical protein [Candidatus Magasanikbacteria bacterium]